MIVGLGVCNWQGYERRYQLTKNKVCKRKVLDQLLEYYTWAQQHKKAKTIFRGFLGSKWRPKNSATYPQNSWRGWRANDHV